MSTYEIGSIVFDKWKICRELGQGSYGTVYEIQREDFGGVYKAALKVITVPQSRTELQSVLDEGMTPPQAKQYFYSVVEDIGRECAIMSRLKGTGNIVSYEDHAVLRHPDGIGWDILIRMELLHPLLPYVYQHPMARRELRAKRMRCFLTGRSAHPAQTERRASSTPPAGAVRLPCGRKKRKPTGGLSGCWCLSPVRRSRRAVCCFCTRGRKSGRSLPPRSRHRYRSSRISTRL